ncbi:hypothetical protein MSSIT_3806 [Methanosarcina siciliae T4/M]|uniref:Uncharacterized protein n=1 Tax=Methanosarcina siciliae T4/M TaxID=1434120 RepID=A0A0E3P969_9EURY|nr:hypothetical protein [Methanosarcina siciliae]AKB30525.1 hypothetical protein MSSIT_3806 [Methanosarcina siciliae T4/M]
MQEKLKSVIGIILALALLYYALPLLYDTFNYYPPMKEDMPHGRTVQIWSTLTNQRVTLDADIPSIPVNQLPLYQGKCSLSILNVSFITSRESYYTDSYNKGSDNKGSDNKGSDNNGSDNKGSDNNGSDNKGSDNNRTYNNRTYNNRTYNNGSDNNGSDNNRTYNNGSDNNGSDNNGYSGEIYFLVLDTEIKDSRFNATDAKTLKRRFNLNSSASDPECLQITGFQMVDFNESGKYIIQQVRSRNFITQNGNLPMFSLGRIRITDVKFVYFNGFDTYPYRYDGQTTYYPAWEVTAETSNYGNKVLMIRTF